jgi:KaiC/GvpD/RAD55 family RecA-like ATPase
MLDRVKSGIEGLDDLVEGGFPKGSVIVVTGGPGVGKTTFCSQYLWQGVSNDEKCLYISTEEVGKEITLEAQMFGWEFEDSENIEIEYIRPEEGMVDQIKELVEDTYYDRIVLDSISTIGMQVQDEGEIRRDAKEILEELRGLDTTVLVTAELADDDSGRLSRYGVTEFIADGVIKLDSKAMGTGLERTLTLLKMRATDMEGGIKDLQFTEDGIEIE